MYFSSKIIAKITLLSFLGAFMITGCDTSSSHVENFENGENRYFDLKGFVVSEIERLSSNEIFVKTVFVNGEKEKQTFETLDLENELQPFFNSDINKPAWSDKYEIDSLIDNSGKLMELNYTAIDEKLKTKLFLVRYENENVTEIIIKNKSKSSVAEILQALTYLPQVGFTIESTQDVSMVDKNHFKIQVDYRK